MQAAIDVSQLPIYGGPKIPRWHVLESALEREVDPSIALLLLGFDRHDVTLAQRALDRGIKDPFAQYILAVDAISKRNYAAADAMLQSSPPGELHHAKLRILERLMSADLAGAEAIARQTRRDEDADFWSWYAQRIARVKRERGV